MLKTFNNFIKVAVKLTEEISRKGTKNIRPESAGKILCYLSFFSPLKNWADVSPSEKCEKNFVSPGHL